jgi:hypothetical protein
MVQMTISPFPTSLYIRHMNIKMKTLIIGKYLGMCELVGESTLSMYKKDVAPLNYIIYAISRS